LQLLLFHAMKPALIRNPRLEHDAHGRSSSHFESGATPTTQQFKPPTQPALQARRCCQLCQQCQRTLPQSTSEYQHSPTTRASQRQPASATTYKHCGRLEIQGGPQQATPPRQHHHPNSTNGTTTTTEHRKGSVRLNRQECFEMTVN